MPPLSIRAAVDDMIPQQTRGRSARRPDGKVRVVFILPSFAGGGAQKVLLNFAAKLDRERFSPVVLVFEASGPWQLLVPENLPVISLDRPRLRSALFSLVRTLRQDPPDIIVSTMAYVNIGMLLVKPFLGGDVRLLVREANTPRRHARHRLGRIAYWLAYRLLYRGADRVLCPATYMADELTDDYGVSGERIVILPNPVDETALRAAAVPPRRAPGGGRRFIAVGRLTEQKGYDRLLDDFARLPRDSRLAILGEGELQGALMRHVDRLNLSGRVALAGFEPQPGPWLAGADALLLPSRWEGLPNVALESLACGTPVIATPEAGGIGEIASLAAPGAVTLASAGEGFVSAMTDVAPRSDAALRASLLPDIYKMERAVEAFEAILAA